VTDPSSSWLLGSPLSKEAGLLAPVSPVRVVLLGTQGLPPVLEVEAHTGGQDVEMVSGGVVEVVPDLQREATKAISLS
jgi:hypothetical protein